MKNDMGENQSNAFMASVITGSIAVVLCVMCVTGKSCCLASEKQDTESAIELTKQSTARYNAMVECSKVRPPLECKQLFMDK